MRTLALLLLLMNLAFLAWQQQFLPWLPWQPELLQPEPTPPYHSTLPKLVLLSEREAEKPKVQAQIMPPVGNVENKVEMKDEHLAKEEHPVKVESPPVIPVTATPVSVEPAQPSASAPVPELKPHVPETIVPASEKIAVPSEPVTPPQPEPVSFQKLAMGLISQGKIKQAPQLVQAPHVIEVSKPKVPAEVIPVKTTGETPQKVELPQKTAAAPVQEAKPNPPSPIEADTPEKNKTTLLSVPPTKPNKTETAACYQIGHFLQLGEAQAASNWFKKKQMTATPQKSDTRLATTTWLYLPAARSLQSAQATQQRLKQLGISDTVVINNPNKYIVSLGVYRDKTSVSERLRELHNKGFDNVKAEEHYATETKYWLNVKIVTNTTMLLSQFQKAFKGLQAKTINCDDLH